MTRKSASSDGIGFQIRRKLEQHGAKLSRSGERFDRGEKPRNEIFGLFQPFDVGDDLMRFDSEAESRREFRDPFLRGRVFHQLAEGEINLHRVQLGGVMKAENSSAPISRDRNRASSWDMPIRKFQRRVAT